MTTQVSQSRRTVESLARTSLRNTKILHDLHHYIAKTPSLTGDDSINLVDALGRPFALPYAFFDQWDVRFPACNAPKTCTDAHSCLKDS